MEPISRRAAITKLLTAAGATTVGAVILTSCGSDESDGASPSTDGASATTSSTAPASANAAGCEEADDTTAGPYPDTLGMIDDSAFERVDITEGLFPDAVPLSLTVQVVNAVDGCTPIVGSQVEIWHCTPEGTYSEYSGQPGGFDGTGETFLRGWQTTDDTGSVTFSTIYPGWYIPRTTHIHIQVYENDQVVKTTQLGFDDALNSEVNSSAGYGGESEFTNSNDQVFVDEGDGADDNLIDATGSVSDGFVGTYTVAV